MKDKTEEKLVKLFLTDFIALLAWLQRVFTSELPSAFVIDFVRVDPTLRKF